MKKKMTILKTIAMLLTLGITLSGCLGNSSQEMMDDSMATSMDREDGTRTVPMDDMEDGSMDSGVMDPME